MTDNILPVQVIYQQGRGWNSLVGALPFLGVMVSILVISRTLTELI